MKKMIKLSLVAAVAVAGLSTTAVAGTLAEAFAASTVKGELKSQYFQKETVAGVKSSVWSNGGNVSVKTGSFNGLTAGVTFQTAAVNADKNVAAYNADQHASGSVMSESYLAYTMNNTTAKIGRQYITTPLVAGSGSRMFKQSFEGYVLVNTDVADTTLVAAYVTKFQGRTSANAVATDIGNAPEFADYNDGAFTVYAKNTSVDNLAIQAQYAQVRVANADDVKVVYVDADYKLAPVTISAQTFQSDSGATTNSDGALYGIKAAGKAGMVSLMAAYTMTDDEAVVQNGVGSGADKGYTAGYMLGGGYSYKADTSSYKVSASAKVAGLGLSIAHSSWDRDAVAAIAQAADKSSETNFIASYAFDKAASVTLSHSEFGGDYGNGQDYRSRLYLSYKF